MRVLFVSPVRFRSMVGGRYSRLAETLLDLGAGVSWVEPPVEGVVEGDPLNPPCEHPAFKLYVTSVAKGPFLLRAWRREILQAAAVRRVLSLEKIDVLVVFDGGGTVLARREARRRGVPVVVDLPDRIYLFEKNPLIRRLHKALVFRALRGAAGATCCSRALLEEALPLNPECVWVPNAAAPGPPPPERRREPGRPVRVVFAGALEPWVDLGPMVEAARRSGIAAFTVVGEGSSKERLLDPSIPPGRIRFLGRVPFGEIPGLLEEHDLGIVPFRVDPLTDAASPLKLFDYWERGLPVLSTPTREMRETGGAWFYRDSRELEGLLEKFARDPEPFLASGREGRRRVEEEFNWKVQGKRFLEVLRKVVERKPGLKGGASPP